MRRLWMPAAALALQGGIAWAQNGPSASETITVTATRVAADVDQVPSLVTVITDEDIADNLVTDIKDLVRFEPGVFVRQSPARFSAALSATGRDGNSGFNIRGLEGERVLFVVDGVRVPDGFSYGPAAFGRGDYVDLDLLSSVEIVRGPASALYGSDGLAGAVSFTTKDPEDFLRGDEHTALRARLGYSQADESWSEGVAAAGRWGAWQGLLAYTRRDGHEQDNQGHIEAENNTRTAPNPQGVESDAMLARIVFTPGPGHRLRFGADYGARSVVTEALSARAAPPYAASSVIDLDGYDESGRWRLGFDHRFEGAHFDFQWAIYYQDSAALQFSAEDRNISADRTRRTTFDTNVLGGMAQFTNRFELGGASHRFIYGADYSLTHQEGLRDGTVPPAFEFFPVRAFPNTDFTLAGVFAQDQISLLDGQLTIFPAVRYDWYDLDPEADALYPGAVARQSDSHVSPQIGLVAWPIETFGVFVNYATGFRAPAPSQVNNYFENLTFGYTSIPNPDLGPETSQSYEAGVRLRDATFAGARWRASASAFASFYEDFISQEIVAGSGAPGDPLVFQYVNLNEVRVAGVEARAQGDWENGLGVTVAGSIVEGDQTSLGVSSPLSSIEPWRVVVGLSYHDPGGAFGGQLIATFAGDKENDSIPPVCTPACFAPPSFTVFDATAYWAITDAATLRLGVFNITDETYWHWGDVRGLSSTSGARDAYTQPGRNVSASLAVRF